MSATNIERDFVLRPKQNEKFRKEDGEALLRTVAEETLAIHNFEATNPSSLTDVIATTIRDRLKDVEQNRFLTGFVFSLKTAISYHRLQVHP
ncbi:hypothetical protein Y032_0100g3268 [Ancylostoma ceylanicum]|nr:hypothetical protein Y032_0100g3268 [Ancylostoma ceylanicum]